jgi:co-chaperonin GroES (HSP10)
MDMKSTIVTELHKPARIHFQRRNTVLKGIHDLYQADLIEMKPYSRINKGFKYILTVINCFTKVADAVPLKDKKGKSVTDAMELVINRDKHKIKHLQTDDGKEYFNKDFAKLMRKHNINHYSTFSEKKATIIERFNRTLKGALYKAFSNRGSHVWHDILSRLIEEYNVKYHRTIGMAPKDVNRNNWKKVLKNIKKNTKPKKEKKQPQKFKVGDKVRISKYKGVFSKKYLPNWTNEVFIVHRVQPTHPETYILKDNKGELLQGGFYGHEMLKSKSGDVYLVEKILRRKKDKALVRWLGFDKSQDSWVPKKDLL